VGELHARLYTALYALPTVALRYFNVYGPRQDPASPYSGVISIFMQRAGEGLPATLHGDGRQTRDFVFVGDVVAANLLAAAASGVAGGVFNVGTGRQVEIAALWQMIARLAGCEAPPRFAASRAGDVRSSAADTRRSAAQLGFQAGWSLEAGLRETHRWATGSDRPPEGDPWN
jgi:UDP-glucose 4-epimerase